MLTDDELRRELTAAFRAEADPVVRSAAPPASLYRQAARRRRRRTSAAALAAAAAAAATAVLATGTLSPAGPGTARPAGPAGTARGTGPATAAGQTGLLLAAAVAAAPPASAAESGMPPFYVATDHGQPVGYVRDSATGRLLSTVALPADADPKLTEVTAARDDRTFVLATYSVAQGTRFYKLRITATGQSAGLTPLAIRPLPAGEFVQSIAVSPDGTRLAVATQKNQEDQKTQEERTTGTIEVVTLATGVARTWTSSGDGLAVDLSWEASGQRLSYFWKAGGASSSGGLWLLDTAAPGTALLSGQRLLPEWVAPDDVQDALLSPDGRTIIASVTYESSAPVSSGAIVGGIVELSARSGRPLRTLLAERASSNRLGLYTTSCLLASIDGTGDHLLVSCDQFGRLDRGRFTAIPGAAPHSAVAAAW